MDFYEIRHREVRGGRIEVYPDFQVNEEYHDIMIRGGAFYAVWDESKKKWNRNERAVKRIVDKEIDNFIRDERNAVLFDSKVIIPKYLKDNSSGKWAEFKAFIRNLPDDYELLDEKVTFKDSVVTKDDHISKSLQYSLQDGEAPAWEEIISTLYDPEEREKIEWAIGSIISGDSRKIQKFLVFYGPQGSGKSTILNIVMKLFDGYYTTFKAENLVRGGDNFNLDFLADDPLIAIDADTELNRIESNALMNQLVSHEQLKVNEKFKNRYSKKPICMLMLGTNKPVKITDAKSGIIRRLIDVEPSGRIIKPERKYDRLVEQTNFELGAIAKHCLDVYQSLGRTYYSGYIPERMMYRTDPFFNFMEEKQEVFIRNGGVTANDLWAMWKAYCAESGVDYIRKRFEIIEEAKSYFNNFQKATSINGSSVRSWFSDLNLEKFNHSSSEQTRRENRKAEAAEMKSEETPVVYEEAKKKVYKSGWLKFEEQHSLLDDILAEYPAQYEIDNPDHPLKYTWKNVKTKLKDLDTSKTHYVKGPSQLIFIDFDFRDADGKKNLEINMKKAGSSQWPKTYAETSNSGGGIHSYYWYDGDVNDLSSMFDEHIEIKVFPEDKLLSIRRRVFLCNDLPIAHISSGLPLKEKKVINWEGVKDDRHLRNLILQAIKKECRPYGEEPKTITCVKYIADILKMAQESNMTYDLRDLSEAVYAFAANSHHNKEECVRRYYDMEFVWPKEVEQPTANILDGSYEKDAPIIILDCEVVRNLTLVIYKELEPDGVAGILKPDGPVKKCVRLYNPKPIDIERLMTMRIVGHNVTGYDNYILYALWMGYTPEQVFELSQDIIVKGNRIPWREARNMSYTDTLDVSSDKKGLKKIEIEMHLPHKEMEIDWSQPLPESEWERLAVYCENDVLATEAYFLSKGWQADFKARQILAALTGMTVNDSTNNLTAQLIFGDVREPWHEFIYPDLKAKFPEYRFEHGKSYFLDEPIGEGGRVYAEEGRYYHVITFDVAGMHPTSEIVENGFGRFTKNYADLYEARIAIKHKDYDKARKMFDGRLAPYLTSDEDADALSHALKIALNSVYGMTAAHFQNRFKDPRNVDNWVAKRGALFMETLRRKVQAMGGHVIHIKTDSIKLVNPTQELQDFVLDFGKQYGYTFEVESKYERICLVNHAVYIALREKDDPGWLKECRKAKEKAEKNHTEYIEPTRWTATGAQFAHPYVFKTLFSKEPLDFWDYCETKTVKTSLYLDLNEGLKDVSQEEKDLAKIKTRSRKLSKLLTDPAISDEDKEKIRNEMEDLQKDMDVLREDIAEGHSYHFVGKAGEFMPILPGKGGGLLMRKEDSGEYGYATGTKGFRWLESESMHQLSDWKDYIDLKYFRCLVDDAKEQIGKYGDFDTFVIDENDISREKESPIEIETPWNHPCGNTEYPFCSDCPNFSDDNYGYCCKLGYNIEHQILGE